MAWSIPHQDLDDSSVLVTIYQAATNINGTILHSAFCLPGISLGEVLYCLWLNLKYLKIVLIGEISKTGFIHLII